MIVLIMGVSGAGKTTVGRLVAARMNLQFADADDYHSSANKAKMAAGHPLDDADREPWLLTLNELLRSWQRTGTGGVLACSALKESYREVLCRGLAEGEPRFVFLDPPASVIVSRLSARQHEFMNPGLLGTQYAILEPPADAIRIANDDLPERVAGEVVNSLARETQT